VSAPGSAQVDRYTALLRSAQQVFAAKGYAAASIEDIARTAGVSKSLVFRHFGSKAGLFASGVVEPLLGFLDEFSADWASPAWRTSDFDTVTTRFVSELYDRMSELRPMLIAMLSVALHDPPAPQFGEFRSRLTEVLDRIATEHEKGRQRFGLVGLDSPLTARITFGLIFAMSAFDSWLLDTISPRPDRDRVVAELSAFVVAALTLRNPEPAPTPTVVEPPPANPPPARYGRRAWGSAPDDVLRAAAELFAAKGYAATSTKEIAKHCDISESLLFFHFPTKEELFARAVFEPFIDTVNELTGGWDRDTWQAQPIDETIRAFIVKLYGWMLTDHHQLLAVIHSSILTDEAGPSSPEVQEGLGRLFDRIQTEHIKAREFHLMTPVDVPLTIRATFAALLAITFLDEWLLSGINPPPTRERLLNELLGYLTAASIRAR
jgi:AcrR family transcriptional regulator